MKLPVMLLLGFLSLASACSAPVRDVEQQPREVAEVTLGVKAALVEASDVNAAAIRIRLDDEAVLLDGFVGSKKESERAESLARKQAPDRQIINRIEIR